MAMEQVVAEHQGGWRVIEEFGTDQKCLCQSIGAGLHGIGDGHPQRLPSPKALKAAWSWGVVMISTSRIPASIRVLSG